MTLTASRLVWGEATLEDVLLVELDGAAPKAEAQPPSEAPSER